MKIILAALFVSLMCLSGCSSKGEAAAKKVCACHEDAKADVTKLTECLKLQQELQAEIQGDIGETQKYLTTMSKCVAKTLKP
jgi:hypothetical protein